MRLGCGVAFGAVVAGAEWCCGGVVFLWVLEFSVVLGVFRSASASP